RVRGSYEGCRRVLDVHGVEGYPDIMVVGRHLGGHKRVGLFSSRGSEGEGWVRLRHYDRDHALHVRDVEGADPVAWPPETRVSGCGCDGIEGRVGRAVARLPETGSVTGGGSVGRVEKRGPRRNGGLDEQARPAADEGVAPARVDHDRDDIGIPGGPVSREGEATARRDVTPAAGRIVDAAHVAPPSYTSRLMDSISSVVDGLTATASTQMQARAHSPRSIQSSGADPARASSPPTMLPEDPSRTSIERVVPSMVRTVPGGMALI